MNLELPLLVGWSLFLALVASDTGINTNLSLQVNAPDRPLSAGLPVKIEIVLRNISGQDQRVQQSALNLFFHTSRRSENSGEKYREFEPWYLRGDLPPVDNHLRPGEEWKTEMWLIYNFRHGTNEVSSPFREPGRYFLLVQYAYNGAVSAKPVEIEVVPAVGLYKEEVEALNDDEVLRFLQTGSARYRGEKQTLEKCRKFLARYPDSVQAPLVRQRLRELGVKEPDAKASESQSK